jgi:hypothetical protein
VTLLLAQGLRDVRQICGQARRHRYPPNQRLELNPPTSTAPPSGTPTRRLSVTGMKSSAEPRAAGDVDVELLKAVAQAWHAWSGNPRPSRGSETGGDDSDAAGAGARPRAGASRHRPSRFKLEAMAAAAAAVAAPPGEVAWDFTRSLWDTYELVSVARKLESGLAIADHAAAAAAAPAVPPGGDARGAGKRARESGRSLRSLFLRSTSRRFEEPNS